MANNNGNNGKTSTKSWLTTLILCWFLGFLGVHRMYSGKLVSGFFMAYGTIASACLLALNVWLGLSAFVLMAAWVVNDFLIISMKKFQDCYGRDIVNDRV